MMARFFKLTRSDQKLHLEVLLLMIKVRMMLWLMPFSSIKTYYSDVRPSGEKDKTVCKLSRSLKTVANYMPGTCLTQALVGYSLLSRHGYSSLVKIGVGKSIEGEFEAHAWLEYEGRIIIGESEKEYVPLLDLKREKL